MSMYRILGQQVVNGKKVGGVLFEGTRVADAWDVSIFEANGHRELSARPVVNWVEVGDWVEHRDACGNVVDAPAMTEKEIADEEEERRLRSLKKAGQRAATQCRRVIKASNFREMLTGTYREVQPDRELCKVHFKEWVRRMKNALPKFQYCASFELQERGSMHFHCATNKLPKHCHYRGKKIESWTLGTIIWREIVGADNGLVFVGGRPRWGDKRRRNQSLAKIASYVSKYIMKDFADSPMGSNRYSRSNSIDLPLPTHIRITDCSLEDLIRVAFEVRPGHVVVSHRIGDFQDSYWLCTEPG
jgi:hypothetical protein